MNIIEKSVIQFLKKIAKSLLYTFLILILSIWGFNTIISLFFDSNSDAWFIVSVCSGIIFTVIYCTLTLMEKIIDISEKFGTK